MSMIRQIVPAEINQLGEREIEVVMSTAVLARDGHILVPGGCRLENYRANPIVLWSHNPDLPIGNAPDIVVESDKIRARIAFAPAGISAKADEVCGLMKSGVVRAVSVGFNPIDGEALNASKPRGGQRFTDWELLELSAVSVPSDPDALVTARAHGDAPMPDPASAPATRATRASSTRQVVIPTGQRGLYNVAALANLLGELGYQTDWAKWEASVEQDGSKVPAMMADALYALADAFVAMAQEEVAELLTSVTEGMTAADEADEELLEDGERAYVRTATSPRVRAWRRALAVAKVRAGKKLSSETARCLREARALHDEAMDMHRSALRKTKEGLQSIDDLMERSGVSDPEDTDSQTVQTSNGTDESEGSSNGRSAVTPPAQMPGDEITFSYEYRQRQAQMLALGATS
jgi:HK97 family phage prohead protease